MAKTLDLIDKVAQTFNITKKDSKEIVETIFEYLSKKLSEKERVEIRNFGSFVIKSKKNNLNWVNKYSLCKQNFYNVLNYKMSANLHTRLNLKS